MFAVSGNCPRKVEMTMGRNPLEFDLLEIRNFGMVSATCQEMADFFGVSVRTIERRVSNPESEFCRAYRKGAALVSRSLRATQLQQALRSDTRMLIWWGKKYLCQSDKPKSQTAMTEEKYFEIDLFSKETKKLITEDYAEKKRQESVRSATS